jgi:hypothetical protein
MALLAKRIKRSLSGRALCRLLLLALLAAVIALVADYLYYQPRIYPGVQMHQLQLGGQTLEQFDGELNGFAVTFTGPAAGTVTVPLVELGLLVDSEALFEAAYRLGRRNNRWPDYRKRLQMMRSKAYLPLQYQLDQAALTERLAELENIFNAEPQNAYFRVSPDERQAELIPDRPRLPAANR